jgi:dihydrofolate reductase
MTLEDVGPDNWRHCAALEVEMTLLIYPVVVGQGTRLFPDTGPETALDLVESRSTRNIGNTPWAVEAAVRLERHDKRHETRRRRRLGGWARRQD